MKIYIVYASHSDNKSAVRVKLPKHPNKQIMKPNLLGHFIYRPNELPYCRCAYGDRPIRTNELHAQAKHGNCVYALCHTTASLGVVLVMLAQRSL